MDMKTFYAVEWGGDIVAIFASDFEAVAYAQDTYGKGAKVYGWCLPADTFQFEG
jgi:hypothetical protein